MTHPWVLLLFPPRRRVRGGAGRNSVRGAPDYIGGVEKTQSSIYFLGVDRDDPRLDDDFGWCQRFRRRGTGVPINLVED